MTVERVNKDRQKRHAAKNAPATNHASVVTLWLRWKLPFSDPPQTPFASPKGPSGLAGARTFGVPRSGGLRGVSAANLEG